MGLKPKPPADLESVNAAVLGRVLGISRASIANLATDGILPRADRGLFNLPACVQAYLRHKLVKAKASDVAVHSLVAERSRLTKIKADNAELEVRRLAGELVPAADIEAAWLAVAGIVRSRLLLIPSKTAARVVALKTPGEAQALLRKELNAALTAIATTPAI
jgi:phage terminase Nu1 subunit (DNA packaging protein)